MKRATLTLFPAFMLVPSVAFAQQQSVEYWMWDPRQAPIYQQCADAFTQANPDLTVNIRQTGWDQYWTSLQTAFISGDAPDVFVGHVTRLPEFVANGIVVDLAPLIEESSFDTSGFVEGLFTAWSRDGAVYGIPKDWDTVAIAYDGEMLEAAGLTAEDLQNLDWNPDDGGSFQDVIAKLTVDASGNRGDSEAFDPNSVQTFGYVSDPISAHGQMEWSFLAESLGWRFIDTPWEPPYHYDDPRLVQALTWLRDLGREHRFAPTAEQTGRLGADTLMFSGRGALTVTGSWLVNQYKQVKPSIAFAPVPAGPEGRRSMFNGLADSIWTGSDVQDAAWEWVQYLGSDACQSVVAQSAVVFPARASQVATAVQAFADNGIDVSAFTDVLTPETTFPFPITDYGNEIVAIVTPALERLMLGEGDSEQLLRDANQRINSLF